MQTGEMQRAEAASNEALALAEHHDFGYLRDLCLTNAGWIQAKLGSPAKGVATIKKGHAGLNAIGMHSSSCWRLGLLAQAPLLNRPNEDAAASFQDLLEAGAA